MAALAAQTVTPPVSNGLTFVAATGGGDTLKPVEGKDVFLMVRNAGGTVCTVTIPRYPTTDVDGIAVPAQTATVPITTGEKWIGPLTSKHVNPATGNIEVAYSQVASVTVAVLAA